MARRCAVLPISKVRFCELWLVAAIVMTLCRGPWMGAGVAALVVALGRAAKEAAIVLVTIATTLVAIPAYFGVKSYLSVNREEAVSESQATAAYRVELLDTYVSVVEQRPAWGLDVTFLAMAA